MLIDLRIVLFYFIFAVAGSDVVAQGVDTARKTAAGDTTRTGPAADTLKPKLLQAATVTRQAPLIQHQIDRIVINVDHQVTASGTTVLELMRQLPGVQVSPDGQISLNGHSGVNVLIDGKPTYLSAEDLAALLGSMPSSELQKLELMTNPPAKFDAAGTGGLINIIRKRNRADGLNGSITASIGQSEYPRYNSSLLLSYKTSKYNLSITESYNYLKSFGGRDIIVDIFNGTTLHSQQVSNTTGVSVNHANNSTAGLDWYLSTKSTLSLTGNLGFRSYRDRTASGMNTFDGKGAPSGNTAFTAYNTDHPLNYTTGLQFSHRLDTAGREWSVEADYAQFRYRPGQYTATIDSDPAGNFESQNNVFLDQTRRLTIVGARADYVHPWPGKGKWEAGWKSSYVRTTNNSSYYNQQNGQNLIDSAQSDYNVNTEAINAAYVNIDRVFKKLSLQAGLRAEQSTMKGQQLFTSNSSVRQNYVQLFPTLFADYKPDARNSLNVQFGRRIDRPDYHELVPFRRVLSPTLFFEGNPYLRPSVTWHSEITWGWRSAVFVTFGYDIDKNYVRTFPYLDANDSTATRIPTNIQGSRSWNLNLSYNHPVSQWWTTNTTASFYQNYFTGTANGFDLSNPGIVTLDLTSNNSLTITDKLTGEIDFETETKRQFAQSTFGAYSVLSLGLRRQLDGGKATLTLNAHNILQSEDRYNIDRNTDLYLYTNLHFHSRYVTLTLNYRFGSGKPTRTQSRSASDYELQRAN